MIYDEDALSTEELIEMCKKGQYKEVFGELELDEVSGLCCEGKTISGLSCYNEAVRGLLAFIAKMSVNEFRMFACFEVGCIRDEVIQLYIDDAKETIKKYVNKKQINWGEINFTCSNSEAVRQQLEAPQVEITHELPDFGQCKSGRFGGKRVRLNGPVSDYLQPVGPIRPFSKPDYQYKK